MGTKVNVTTVYRMVRKCNAWEKGAKRSACKTAEYPPEPGLVVTATKPFRAKTWTQTCCNTMGSARSPRTNGWLDDRYRNLFVKLRRPVRAGEEIFVEYGYSARRQTLWGFGPLAKYPKVPFASKSNLRPRNVKTWPYGEMQIFGWASGSRGGK